MKPVQDKQTVDTQGRVIAPGIFGVVVHRLVTHSDERGSLTELYRQAWGIHPEGLVYAKLITVRPGRTKGYVKHLKQDDRMCILYGAAQYVLYDDRADSPTHRLVQEVNIDEHGRSMLIIPKGVYHAVRCVSSTDLIMVNLPTQLYDHANPDKYRLPLQNDVIPYTWRD